MQGTGSEDTHLQGTGSEDTHLRWTGSEDAHLHGTGREATRLQGQAMKPHTCEVQAVKPHICKVQAVKPHICMVQAVKPNLQCTGSEAAHMQGSIDREATQWKVQEKAVHSHLLPGNLDKYHSWTHLWLSIRSKKLTKNYIDLCTKSKIFL
jgi:hypothetical protein